MDLEYLKNNPMPDVEQEFEDTSSRSPTIVVHLSDEEMEELDRLQGGEYIDPKTDMRSYVPLEDLIEIPEIRELLDAIAIEMMQGGVKDPDIKKLESGLPKKNQPFSPTPSNFDPEVLEISSKGQHGDNDLALMPLSVADYFDSLRGGPDYNPETGLRQYGFFKEFIRVAATVIGAAIGGPAGAGVGAAAGNLITGAGPEKSLKRGFGVYGLTSAVDAGLSAFGGGSGSSGGFGSLFGGGNNASKSFNTGNVYKDILLNDKGSSTSSGILGGLGNILSSPALPLIAGAGLMFKGHKDSDKRQRELDEQKRQELDQLRKYYQIQNRGPRIKGALNRTINPKLPSYWDQQAGTEHMSYLESPIEYEYFAKGGQVTHGLEPGEEFVTSYKYLDGETKGQDDEIKINLPAGAYVVDASTTSMLGDGNSKAGAKLVEKLSHIAENEARKLPNLKIPEGRVPCLLSDGEPSIPPAAIAALGGGDNDKGAKAMDKIIKKIRLDKSRNKEKLPPKIKSLHKYAPKNSDAYKILKKVGNNA